MIVRFAVRQIMSCDMDELVLSLASLWEVAIKTGKLNTIGSSVAYLRDEMEAKSPNRPSASSAKNSVPAQRQGQA